MTNTEQTPILPGFYNGQRVHLIAENGTCLVTGLLYRETYQGSSWVMVEGLMVTQDDRPYQGRHVVAFRP